MEMRLPVESLKTQIKNADSESTIDSLLEHGKSYQFASRKTRQAWVKFADLRRNELRQSTIEQTEVKKVRKIRKDKGQPRRKKDNE